MRVARALVHPPSLQPRLAPADPHRQRGHPDDDGLQGGGFRRPAGIHSRLRDRRRRRAVAAASGEALLVRTGLREAIACAWAGDGEEFANSCEVPHADQPEAQVAAPRAPAKHLRPPKLRERGSAPKGNATNIASCNIVQCSMT